MNVLVIGGAGYIGSHVVLELLEKKHNITIYDNLSSGSKKSVFPGTKFIYGDILDEKLLRKTLREGVNGVENFDVVMHFAALKAAGESMIYPEKYSINNITGTLNILNEASNSGVKCIVFSSSAAVFGEPEYLPVDEAHPLKPINYYGFTKLEIERFLSWYDNLKGLKYAALRYFNAAGYDPAGRIKEIEAKTENLLPLVMEAAVGKREKLQIFGDDYDTPDGTCIRDYIHVTDLAKAHILAMEYVVKNKSSLTVNLGSENGVSVKEMIEIARTVTGQKITAEATGRRAGDPAKLIASAKKANDLLKWKAEKSDAETLIKTTWAVYKEKYIK
jgi:UDP-glucose 4-epimerase